MSTAVERVPPFTMTAGRFLLAAPILLAMGIPAWRAGARLVGLGITIGGPGAVDVRLLADELVRLDVVETVSHETIRRPIQQTPSNHG